MALLWFDGFESYNDHLDANALANVEVLSYLTHFQTSGRRGGRNWRGNATQSRYTAKVPGTPATIIFGLALYFNSATAPSYNSSYPFIRIRDGFPSGNIHLNFFVKPDREIEVRDSALNILGTTSGANILAHTWRYIEVKVTISGSVGQITIKVGETEVLNTSADKDTLNGSNVYVGAVELNYVHCLDTLIDDFYICDTSGSKNNDFLGDIRVDALRPNAAGTYTDFTPSAGSNHENVDEVPGPDDDTTYNDGANVGDQDSYQMPDLPAPAGTTIFGVKTQATVRKTDAGAMKCKLLTRAGTTDDLGDEIILSDSYTTHAEIFENNPDDSAAWEDADVNSMEPGVETTA